MDIDEKKAKERMDKYLDAVEKFGIKETTLRMIMIRIVELELNITALNELLIKKGVITAKEFMEDAKALEDELSKYDKSPLIAEFERKAKEIEENRDKPNYIG